MAGSVYVLARGYVAEDHRRPASQQGRLHQVCTRWDSIVKITHQEEIFGIQTKLSSNEANSLMHEHGSPRWRWSVDNHNTGGASAARDAQTGRFKRTSLDGWRLGIRPPSTGNPEEVSVDALPTLRAQDSSRLRIQSLLYRSQGPLGKDYFRTTIFFPANFVTLLAVIWLDGEHYFSAGMYTPNNIKL